MQECAGPNCSELFSPKVWNQRFHSPLCKRAGENVQRRAPASVVPAQGEDDEVFQLEFLRSENRRLSNLYTKHKANGHETLLAVYEAAYNALSSITIKPIKPPKKTSSRKDDDTVVNPSLADWQISKVTPSYNSEVCRERVALYGEKVVDLTRTHRSAHTLKRAHVYLLGDLIEGEIIFAGQAFEIDSSLYRQIVNGVEILTDFLRQMLGEFDTVHVAGVIGNHGRASKNKGDYNPETNFDRLLYKFTSMIFADEPRITFNIPDGSGRSNFYLVDYVGDFGTLLLHGDQFPSPSATYGYQKKVLGWAAGAIKEPFSQVMIGHYHQNAKMTFGEIVLRIVGSTESDNLYAQEKLGTMGRPSQHYQLVSPAGVLLEADCFLD